MTITAHSGAFDTPDNSLEFVRKVLDENCEIFEIDVTFRPDGTPVIIHKGSPGSNEGILLEDAFSLLCENGSIQLNLDLKSTANLPAVDELLKKYGLIDRAFFTGVGKEWAETVRANSSLPYYLNADIPTFLRNYGKSVRKCAKETKDCGAIGLNTHYPNIKGDAVKLFHEEGLLVSVWTVNDEKTIKKMLACGVDNITSRHPDLVKKCIAD